MEQKQKLIVTRWKQGVLSMLLEGDIDIELQYDEPSDICVGNIYIAKVKDVVKNINAVFVEIMPGTRCYLSMEDARQPIYLNRIHQNADAKPVQGDEILVQVMKDRVKTKDAVVTTNLSFTGRYIVLTTGNKKLGVSAKLSKEKRNALRKELTPYVPEDTGIVIRTNAQYVSIDEIMQELQMLNERRRQLINAAMHRTCYSILYRTPTKYLTLIRDLNQKKVCEIVTDDDEIYQNIKEQADELGEGYQKLLTRYHDELLPLEKLYSIDSRLERALCKRVWLKSGGYLVIEPTEALTVIDVNTGKYDGRKDLQDTFLKINLEAAKEAARQLRLRNISGIVIIDFINMEDAHNRETLLDAMRSYVSSDRIKTEVHDMTELYLVEITRKKVDRPLYEMMKESCQKLLVDVK